MRRSKIIVQIQECMYFFLSVSGLYEAYICKKESNLIQRYEFDKIYEEGPNLKILQKGFKYWIK